MTLDEAIRIKSDARTRVYCYIQQYGIQARGLMAEACQLSERAIYKALRELEEAGIPLIKCSVSSHEIMDHGETGTANDRSGSPAKKLNKASDPLFAKLAGKAWGMWPGAVCNVIKKYGRDVVAAAVKAVEEAKSALGDKIRSMRGLLYHELNRPGSVGIPDSHYRDQEHARSGYVPEKREVRVVKPEPQVRELTVAEKAMQILSLWKAFDFSLKGQEKARATAERAGIPWGAVLAAKAAVS